MNLDYAEAARLIRLGRRAERRGKAVEGCLTALLTRILNVLLAGWTLMLAVGVAHHVWIPALPTIGYWWAVLLTWLTSPLFAATPSTQKKEAGA